MRKILVIDDEKMLVDILRLMLKDMGYEAHAFTSAVEGERAALESDFSLILLDLRMPGRNGAEITKNIMQRKPHARILIITAYPDDPLAAQALEAGAISLLQKPFEMSKLLYFLEAARQ